MRCMHCINKSTVVDNYGRNLCKFHDNELNKDKSFEAWCVVGTALGITIIILIAVLTQKGVYVIKY